MNHMPNIIRVNKEHPELCSKEVALMLGVSWGHVRQVQQMKGLKFASGVERARQIPELRRLKAKP